MNLLMQGRFYILIDLALYHLTIFISPFLNHANLMLILEDFAVPLWHWNISTLLVIATYIFMGSSQIEKG